MTWIEQAGMQSMWTLLGLVFCFDTAWLAFSLMARKLKDSLGKSLATVRFSSLHFRISATLHDDEV